MITLSIPVFLVILAAVALGAVLFYRLHDEVSGEVSWEGVLATLVVACMFLYWGLTAPFRRVFKGVWMPWDIEPGKPGSWVEAEAEDTRFSELGELPSPPPPPPKKTHPPGFSSPVRNAVPYEGGWLHPNSAAFTLHQESKKPGQPGAEAKRALGAHMAEVNRNYAAWKGGKK